jgi:RHS repeat-associated protein
VTDSSGKVLDQTTYDPYGNTADSMPGQASAVEFTGRENDGNSFYYMRGRYYSPSIARFISRDPAGLAGGLNMYTYAGDSPTNFTDPTGLDFSVEGGPFAAAARSMPKRRWVPVPSNGRASRFSAPRAASVMMYLRSMSARTAAG